MIVAVAFASCSKGGDDDGPDPGPDTGAHVPVTNITGVPAAATAEIPLTLSGTVVPSTATNKSIVWGLKSAGTTGATLTGSTFNATSAGKAIVTATVVNGLTANTPYTKEFEITVVAAGTPLTFTDSHTFDIPNRTENDPITDINVAAGVSGGTPPYTFSLGEGSTLPAGITLSPAGIISGSPTTPGDAGTATIVVEDSSDPQQSASITIYYGAIHPATIRIFPEIPDGELVIGPAAWACRYAIETNQPVWDAVITPAEAQTWCSVEKISNSFLLRIENNTSLSPRTPATLTVSAGTAFIVVRIEQQGAPTGEDFEYKDDTGWD